jgi:hypothetical protein
MTSEAAIEDALRSHPTMVVVRDEFGHVVNAMLGDKSGHQRTVATKLTDLYGMANDVLYPRAMSKAGLTPAQREQLVQANWPVHNPVITLLGLTAPGPLMAAIKGAQILDGTLNRFLPIIGDQNHTEMDMLGDAVPDEVNITGILDWSKWASRDNEGSSALSCAVRTSGDQINAASAMAAEPRLIPLSECTKRFSKDLNNMRNMCRDEEDPLAPMWVRSAEIAIRIALILSQSRRDSQIRAQDLAWAIRYVEVHMSRTIVMLRDEIHESVFEAVKADVLRLIAKAAQNGESITLARITALSRKFRGLNNKPAQDGILASLEDAGEIVEVPTRNNKGKRYAPPELGRKLATLGVTDLKEAAEG